MRRRGGGMAWFSAPSGPGPPACGSPAWLARRPPLEDGPPGETGPAEPDEKQDRAEHLVPPEVQERKDDEHEFYRRKHGEGREDQPVREGQIDQDDFKARDHAQDHGNLDVDMKLAGLMMAVVRSGGDGGGHGGKLKAEGLKSGRAETMKDFCRGGK